MSSLLPYLMETSLVLLILYAMYWLLLRRETFFSFNRYFLLSILLLSFLFPLLSVDLLPSSARVTEAPISELRDMRKAYHRAFDAWPDEIASDTFSRENTKSAPQTETGQSSLVLTILLLVYATGCAVVIIRLFGTLAWLLRLRIMHQAELRHGLKVVKVPQQIAPFSFLNAVYLSENLLQSKDLAQILTHEKVHLEEKHSLDLIFVQLSAAILWFNPIVWQLLKSLKATHEYIADKKTIDQGYSLVTYQTLLLRQLISVNSRGLIHNFNLSFIKKRITMMTIQKSGWAGKAKVAFTLSAVVALSIVMMQCNSTLDEQVLSETSSVHLFGQKVNVPILPLSANQLDHKQDASLKLTVKGNEIFIEDEAVAVQQLAARLANGTNKNDVIFLQIDQQERMGMVREIQEELRKADRRKIAYLGQTSEGSAVEVPIMLPPLPDNEAGIRLPEITDEYAREHELGLLKVRMGENKGTAQQQEVYEFVKSYVEQQSPDYVIAASYEEEDSFADYLLSLYQLMEGFHQIYEERAQVLYGKHFSEISKNRSASKEYQAMYDAIRKKIPMAISIAEN